MTNTMSQMRISRQELYMQVARLFSQRSTCLRGQVGAILIKDFRIIASGYNGPAIGQPHCEDNHCDLNSTCTHAIHAEANLIAFCAKHGIATNNATLVVTTTPCRKCAELVIQAGIKYVIYDSDYRDEAGFKLLKDAGITIIKYNINVKLPDEVFL